MTAPSVAVTVNFDELPEATLPDLDWEAAVAALGSRVTMGYTYDLRIGLPHVHKS